MGQELTFVDVDQMKTKQSHVLPERKFPLRFGVLQVQKWCGPGINFESGPGIKNKCVKCGLGTNAKGIIIFIIPIILVLVLCIGMRRDHFWERFYFLVRSCWPGKTRSRNGYLLLIGAGRPNCCKQTRPHIRWRQQERRCSFRSPVPKGISWKPSKVPSQEDHAILKLRRC